MSSKPRKLRKHCPLLMFLLLPAPLPAESGVEVWIQRYNGPSTWSDATAVAVDRSNAVIVTGSSMGSGSYGDYATIKYSSAGAPLWTNRYNGPANSSDTAAAVTVDGSDNVIVTGTADAGPGTYLDYATIKYSSTGAPLWTNVYNGPGSGGDRPYAVAVDSNNDVIVAGGSFGGFDSGADYATIKYSNDGVPLWTNRYTRAGAYNDLACAVAIDRENNVIVTGSSLSSASMVSSDYATIKYSSAGAPLWTNAYNGPGDSLDMPSALAADGNNDIIVTGRSSGAGGSDFATIKYSSDGVPLWTNRYANGSACALAVDRSNNVIVTGSSLSGYVTIKYSTEGVPLWTNSGTGLGDSIGEAAAVAVDRSNNVIVTGHSAATNSSPYNYDYVTVKYSGAGVPLWAKRYNGPGNGDDEACGLAVDDRDSVIVTGSSTRSGGSADYATIKYVCVPAPVISELQLTNGNFHMRIDGVLQSGTLLIEAATQLAVWAPIFTNNVPTNVVFYTDPNAGQRGTRFYRACQWP